MNRTLSSYVLFGCVVLASACVWFWPDSLLRPNAAIRGSILRQTPLGSTSTEVHSLLASKGWLVANYNGNSGGFVKRLEGSAKDEVVGVSSLQGNLGDIGPMNVTAFWGFDHDDRLIDVWVWRTFDAP